MSVPQTNHRRHPCLTRSLSARHRADSFLVLRSFSGLALLCCLAILLPSCSFSGLNFLQDTRVTILAPKDRALLDLPVTITWSVNNFKVTGEDGTSRRDQGYFGIYVDRAPQPPNKKQEWLVREDETCLRTPGCPNKDFLAQRDIHSSTEMSFVIEFLRDLDPELDRRDMHEVTIVLLNGKGERIGESAFTVEFEVKRET